MRLEHILSSLKQALATRPKRLLACLGLGFLLVGSISTTAFAALPAPNPSPDSVLSSQKIAWRTLTAEQKIALAPLAAEWDAMEELPKRKWLVIANKYTAMKPDEQQRVQERLKAWATLSSAQRMAIRENFSNTAKKTAEQKSTQWQAYQQLSDEEKQKLANEAKSKKNVTAIQPESKRTAPVLAPLKKGPPPAPITDNNALASQTIIK